MNWDYKTLEQMGNISRGRSRHRPRNDSRLFGGKYPFIQTADVKDANFYITNYSQTYNEIGLKQSKLWEKGTLCITIAANIADTAILDIQACFPDSIMGFNAYVDVANTKFVKYSFDILKKKCRQISQGTAQDNLSWEKLSTIKFPCPSIDVQNHIVNLLSRYDDLIENYQKQIKLLEEAAQRIYKEWFVDFRFPGYESVKVVDGVPEGWEKKKVGEFVEKISRTKQIQSSDILEKGEIPVVDQSRIFIAGYTNDVESLVKYNHPIIVFGDHTRILKYIQFPFAKGADGTQLILSNNLIRMPQSLFYLSLLNIDLSNYSYARHFKYLKAENILIPDRYVAKDFDNFASIYLNKIQNCRNIIVLLTEARDRLLPRLMSGEIEV